ncbi:helix-turn-helix domain-containing protein [Faecalimonas sp.]
MTRQTISCWERNIIIPDIQVLQELAKIYGIILAN